MPVNEGDCLFSFNQHTRFSLLQSAHFFSQVDCEKIGSCRGWLVIHVSTYFMLFFPFNQAALYKWCEECSYEICLADLNSIGSDCLKSCTICHMHTPSLWAERHDERSEKGMGQTFSHQVRWLTRDGLWMLRECQKGGGGDVELRFNLVRSQTW